MRAFILALVAIPVFATSWATATPEKKPALQPLASSVRVTLPLGTISIAYIESDEGMVLDVYCRGTSVRAQRVFLGDGKIAVKYEAGTDGFLTPNGAVNAASIELKDGSKITVKREQISKWGAQNGEVYLNTESIKFEVQRD